MLFDSHSHLNFSVFNENYPDIIADCTKKNIGVINVGSQIDTSKRAVEIANEYPDKPIYAAVGLHPVHLSGTETDGEEVRAVTKENKFDEKLYQDLLDNDKHKKIVAIGETGLDYFHELTHRSPEVSPPRATDAAGEDTSGERVAWKEKQKQGFADQLNFAVKNNLPVILHARGSQDNPQDAYLDIIKILENMEPARRSAKGQLGNEGGQTGVIHCFGSSMEIAQKFLDQGFYIGFTGIITFRNKSLDKLRDIVKNVPLDKILVETDAPYLAPEPYRGQQNFPQYTELVARKVAEIKGVDYEEVAKITSENVKKLFSLKH